jgi:predicted nucleic-acid-binding protein
VKGLDTNVLARYLTQDDPKQSASADAFIHTVAARKEHCFISAVVLCELTWVLRYAYKVSKADVVMTLEKLLTTRQFTIGDRDHVRHALNAYRAGRADFADYLIGALSRDAGCDVTATFDRRLRDNSAFQVI